jgi:folate-dependent tRNA-U54 methylase TrmFO/GidA
MKKRNPTKGALYNKAWKDSRYEKEGWDYKNVMIENNEFGEKDIRLTI